MQSAETQNTGLAAAVALLLAFAGGNALAQSGNPVHGHEALNVDAAMTLGDVVDKTLESYPAGIEIAAHRDEAMAWQARGRRWSAGQPVVSFRYQTDRYGDDLGLAELESGLQFTLWKWGERRSTRDLGKALDAEADAASTALRWDVAGLLRELFWQIARAAGEHALAEESMAVAERLAATIERRYELGDAALRDALLARSALLDARATLAETDVALVDAERAYRNLTRLDDRPPFVAEALTSLYEIDRTHPVLAFGMSDVDRAKAKQALLRQSGVTAPTLMIGPRRERTQIGEPYADSVGIHVAVPFGGRSHTRTRATEAGREVAAAQAALRQAERDLDLQLHEASHGLSVARSNLGLASDRAKLAEQGYRLGESAYAKGELGLIELLSLHSVYLDAQRQALRFEIEEKRQTARYNQALGVMP